MVSQPRGWWEQHGRNHFFLRPLYRSRCSTPLCGYSDRAERRRIHGHGQCERFNYASATLSVNLRFAHQHESAGGANAAIQRHNHKYDEHGGQLAGERQYRWQHYGGNDFFDGSYLFTGSVLPVISV